MKLGHAYQSPRRTDGGTPGTGKAHPRPLSTIMPKRKAKEDAKVNKAKASLSYRDGQIDVLDLCLQ